MHTCKSCPRTFASKSSLNRHERNHQQVHRWHCAVCHASFVRQDLLKRHSRMHVSDGDESIQQRQRSRTACNACRTSRTKCSGHPPCNRCQDKHLVCSLLEEDESTTDRVSNPLASNDSNLDESVVPSDILDNHENQFDLPQSMDGLTEPLNPSSHHAVPLIDSTSNPESISPNCIAWPWLHEDVFLQTDLTTNLDWFEFGCLHDQSSVNHDSLTQPHRVDSLSVNTASEQDSPTGQVRITQPADSLDALPDRTKVVQTLVQAAMTCSKAPSDRSADAMNMLDFYGQINALFPDVVKVFSLNRDIDSECSISDFIKLYLDNFWQLWPLCPRHQFDNADFDPLLYLAMVSIGAMYGSKQSGIFGAVLHTALREELVNPLLDIDLGIGGLLPLGQARSLTQAAALYFGQKKAFSYAFHLGGALVAQARKMNLFTQNSPDTRTPNSSEQNEVRTWLRRESKKRLAFAILRLEMYTSALHSTRPLVSAKEMHMEMPCSRYLWFTSFSSSTALAAAIQQELLTRSTGLLYSDLFRIATDPAENLPQMEMLHNELLSNAIQEQIWEAVSAKASLDRQPRSQLKSSTFRIETGLDTVGAPDYSPVLSGTRPVVSSSAMSVSVDSQVIECYQNMKQLQDTIATTTIAVSKCRQRALADSARLSCRVQLNLADRSNLLSCLLVYHLSYLQIHAPMEYIHKVCHLTPTSVDSERVPYLREIIQWSETPSAFAAKQHALRIYRLLHSETTQRRDSRAHVNFLTMIGLYHSAVLVWLLTNLDKSNEVDVVIASSLIVPSEPNDMELGAPTMDDFVQVFRDISPQWAPRSSFLTAIQKLSTAQIPFAIR